MKRNPYLAEKVALRRLNLEPNDWLVRKSTSDGTTIQNKYTGTKKFIPRNLMK